MARECGPWIWRATRPWRRLGWCLDRRFCTMGKFSSPLATSRPGTKRRRWWCVSENNEEQVMKIHWILAADAPSGVIVDKDKKTVTVPCKIAPRKLAKLDQIYPVEVIACWPESKNGQKAHETVVVFDINPSEVHKALESFGLKAGKPAQGEGEKAEGPEVKVMLELPDG